MSTSKNIYEVQERATTDISDVPLTEEDEEALRANDRVTLKHGKRLKIRQFIGVIGLPSDILLDCRPKDSLEGFKPLYYLAKAGRISEELVTGPREVGFTAGESFIDVVANVFDRELERLIRQGLQTDYVTNTEATSHVRGQLQMSKQLVNQEPLATSFQSRFDELTADIPLNQLLLYTVNELIERVRDAAIQSRLEHRAAQLSHRITYPVTPPDPREITLTRETQAYRPLIKLVEQILNERYIDTFGNQTKLLQSVLVNTETLFEEVVYRAIEELVQGTRYMIHGDGDPDNISDSDIGYLLRDQSGRGMQGLEPDVFLRERGKPVWVADAKWREDDSPKRENLYQVTAYQRKVGAPATMFYPEQGGTISGTYDLTEGAHTNVWTGELQVVELPLGAGTYKKFEQRLQAAISKVIQQQLTGF